IKNSKSKIFSSFGIHPQLPLLENLSYLESLLEEKKLNAVGETGFDFYTEEFSRTENQQTEAFLVQIELAQKHSLPVIIHGRKAIEKFFFYSKMLSKIPLVIFHSFSGTCQEALSLLNHGINARFSFSKQILNGNKKAVQCVSQLPLEKILFETDAPFQTLKGEENTMPSEILKVYEEAFFLKTDSFVKDDKDAFLEFCMKVSSNFSGIF
ncbi:MAG: TatD family hydrolase, partial [Treponema sp.]